MGADATTLECQGLGLHPAPSYHRLKRQVGSAYPGLYGSSQVAAILMCMTDNDRLIRYLELCRRIYKRMQREGSWPWPSTSETVDRGGERQGRATSTGRL